MDLQLVKMSEKYKPQLFGYDGRMDENRGNHYSMGNPESRLS